MTILQHDLFKSKRCEECRKWKPHSAFRVNVNTPDQLSYYCRECTARDRITFGSKRKTRDAPKGKKQCVKCREVKVVKEFARLKNASDGLNYYCRACVAETDRANRDRSKASSWRRRYGVTEQVYWDLFEQQGGTCAICGKPETWIHKGTLAHLSVDHDHVTGAIRGLLCRHCNHGLGRFFDKPELLEQAVTYLRQASVNTFDT